eukprot:TRINITY_DN45213_c0_g1_i1.p1 TRINITY_DN45213_c0_g1~~TRINITY_DN45213_c0_g1_i1.p1  ORF type:complete len:110 (-),score=7.02 TRINITY_DN45213_c0_g1_i1:95-424(-)
MGPPMGTMGTSSCISSCLCFRNCDMESSIFVSETWRVPSPFVFMFILSSLSEYCAKSISFLACLQTFWITRHVFALPSYVISTKKKWREGMITVFTPKQEKAIVRSRTT